MKELNIYLQIIFPGFFSLQFFFIVLVFLSVLLLVRFPFGIASKAMNDGNKTDANDKQDIHDENKTDTSVLKRNRNSERNLKDYNDFLTSR